MEVTQRSQRRQLAQMSSAQAADWLLSTYPIESPDWGEGLFLIPHRSWKKSDQLRLARHYLQKVPYASQRGYQVFASFMSVASLLGCIREQLPLNHPDLELLLYHLQPTLAAMAKHGKDAERVAEFLGELKGQGAAPSSMNSSSL
ncbi:hypothetical protein JYG34_09685 [Pseudomonas entomophila]|uniref:hypothetical protein n=1 Tax=Pseudomonas entomophila TaxID=312306 RepID=UPI001BCB2C75|nr:hypothetical protein [Pseudomonas entomophila]QVM93258.1 hypothetical protein JYG34_09685 [Pseudomonas entomophila]